jgi:hypothetical protein
MKRAPPCTSTVTGTKRTRMFVLALATGAAALSPGINTNPQNISVSAGYSTQNGPTKEAPTTTTTPTTATTPDHGPTKAADHREEASDSDPDAVGAGDCCVEDSDSDYDSEADSEGNTTSAHDGAPGTEKEFIDIINRRIGFVPVTIIGKLQALVSKIFSMLPKFGYHQGKQRGTMQKGDASSHCAGITSAVEDAISAIGGARVINFFLNLNLRKKPATTRKNLSGKHVPVRDTHVHVDKASVAAANARGIYQVAEADGSVTWHCKTWTYTVKIPAGYMLIADIDIMIENKWGIKHSHGPADATQYDKDFTGTKQQVVLNNPSNSLSNSN